MSGDPKIYHPLDETPNGAASQTAYLRAAVSFLTILPAGPKILPRGLAASRAYFPLAGLLLGAGLAALDAALRQVLPTLLSSAVIAVGAILATRALHFEGFVDCCDALFGGFTRERRLEVLKDPQRGSFAIAGGAGLLLVSWAATASLLATWRPWAIVLYPCLSRWAMVIAMELYPYARPQGLGSPYFEGRRPWHVAVAFVTALAAAVLLMGPTGLMLLSMATGTALILGRWMNGLLGGLTGDCYGAINEVAAAAVLLLAVVFATQGAPWSGAVFPTGA